MQDKQNSFEVQCDKCGRMFIVAKNSIKHDIIKIDDVLLKVSWFLCPKCREVYIVGVSDKYSDEAKNQFEKKRRKYQKSVGRDPYPVQQKLHQAMMDKLDKYKRYQMVIKQRYEERAKQCIYLRYVAV